jgi:UDP-glucose 4-epimerase
MSVDVLLTGATGFVGGEIGRELRRAGHAVSALVRGENAAARLEAAGVPARAFSGDLADHDAVRAAVRGATAVVHAAAIVDPRAQADRAAVARVNRDLAIELGRIAKAEGVRRFVFISSIAAVGFWSGHVTAQDPCRPETGYGRAKRDAEAALAAMATPDFDVVILRPPTVYGPGEPYNFLDWVRSVHSGLFRVIGSGANRMPLVTTRNVAVTAVAAVERRLPAGVYFVTDREEYSMNRIHRAILRALRRRPRRLRIPTSVAWAAGLVNETLRKVAPTTPLLLSRARVRTLTIDQRLDVTPLLRAGVAIDAELEDWVDLTVRDYERRGLLRHA